MNITSSQMAGIETKYGTFDYQANPDFLKSLYSSANALASKAGLDLGSILSNLPGNTKPPKEVLQAAGAPAIPKKWIVAGAGAAGLLVLIMLMKKKAA